MRNNKDVKYAALKLARSSRDYFIENIPVNFVA
jgi:hypothetical protein